MARSASTGTSLLTSVEKDPLPTVSLTGTVKRLLALNGVVEASVRPVLALEGHLDLVPLHRWGS